MSLAIFLPHFVIRILSSAMFHPRFIIRIFVSAIRHPPSAIRHLPLSGPDFTETPWNCSNYILPPLNMIHAKKGDLIEFEGFWPGVRRNIIQFKWYVVFSSIMSMLRNLVLTKFWIYLNLQSCSCPQIKRRTFSVMPCMAAFPFHLLQEILITLDSG